MKAVFHINEMSKWTTTINAGNNLMDNCRKNEIALDLKIVVNGEAVSIINAQDEATQAQRGLLLETAERGIQVMFCKKAMELRKLAWPDDFEKMTIVPSSAMALIEHQEKGYAYIKQ